MRKDFDKWNEEKKIIDSFEKSAGDYFNERDVWWCSVGLNIGNESNGKGEMFRRPVLVLKKLSSDSCIALPLSSQKKQGSWFHEIQLNTASVCVLLYQIRMVDKRRFQRKIGRISLEDFLQVKEKLEALLELSHYHPETISGIEGLLPKSNHSVSNCSDESQESHI